MLQSRPLANRLLSNDVVCASNRGSMTQVTYALPGEKFSQAQAINLSRSGASLIMQGDQTLLQRQLTFQVEGLSFRGRVVREQSIVGGSCRVVGVRFEDLSPSQKAFLDQQGQAA